MLLKQTLPWDRSQALALRALGSSTSPHAGGCIREESQRAASKEKGEKEG